MSGATSVLLYLITFDHLIICKVCAVGIVLTNDILNQREALTKHWANQRSVII